MVARGEVRWRSDERRERGRGRGLGGGVAGLAARAEKGREW